MYQSRYFTQTKLIDWENKAEADKTWVNLQTYFTNFYQIQEQFTKSTAKNSMYHEETNHMGSGSNTQTVGTNITTGDETEMTMADIQETHDKQLHCMQEANDKAM